MLRLLLALLLAVSLWPAPAEAANYCVISLPSTNEIGNYSRNLEVERFSPNTNQTVRWQYQGAIVGTDTVTLTMHGPDAGQVTTLGTVVINSNREAAFTFNKPEGRYALQAECSGNKATVLHESIVVGDPPLTGTYWSCRERFEHQYGIIGSGPCAPHVVPTWPPAIRTIRNELPSGLQPFPIKASYTSAEWANLAYIYDIGCYGKERRNYVTLPNPNETSALSWAPVYFHASIDGTRVLQADGFCPVARIGQVIKAIPHPQGAGFYVLAVNGRLALVKTTGEIQTFAGYRTTVPHAPAYSELSVSNVQSDRDFNSARITWHGEWETGTTRRMRRPWGFAAWPSAAPHNVGLHQFWVFDTFNHRILYVDHRQQHGPSDPEGPGPGGQSTVRQILGTYGVPTGPCFDHPWDGTFGPESNPGGAGTRWLYWAVRGGGANSVITKAAICRVQINLTTGSAITTPEVFVQSVYGLTHADEEALVTATGGRYAQDGPERVQAIYPTTDGSAPGFIMPNAVDLDSGGNLIISEQCASRIRKLNLQTRVMSTVRGRINKPLHCMEITMQVDREGVLGIVDAAYGGVYGVESDFVIGPTGGSRRLFPWTGISPSPGEWGEGRLSQTVMGIGTNYHWVYAPGNAALPCMFVGHNAHGGMFLICQRLSNQGNIDTARFVRGMTAWKNAQVKAGVTYPARALTAGPLGVAATIEVGWPEIGIKWSEQQALDWLQSVAGMDATEASDVRYAAVHHMKYKAINDPTAPASRTLTIAHAGDGFGTTSPPVGTTTHEDGTSVPLAATAAVGSVFRGWNCANPVLLSGGNKACTATFEAVDPPPTTTFTLTVTHSGTGTGTSQPPPGVSTHLEDTVVTLASTPSSNSELVAITGTGCGPTSVTLSQNRTCDFEFGLKKTLTITIVGQGTTSPAAGVTYHATDASVTIVSTPGAGWQLDAITGDADCTDGSLTMSEDLACTVTFEPAPDPPPGNFTLTILCVGTGTGTTSPVACGAAANFTENTVVPLVATPGDNQTFGGWTGDADCSDGSVTLSANRACTATFTTKISLTITHGGAGSGVTDPVVSVTWHTAATVVALTATAADDSTFTGWAGDTDCTDGSVTLSAHTACVAMFQPQVDPPGPDLPNVPRLLQAVFDGDTYIVAAHVLPAVSTSQQRFRFYLDGVSQGITSGAIQLYLGDSGRYFLVACAVTRDDVDAGCSSAAEFFVPAQLVNP